MPAVNVGELVARLRADTAQFDRGMTRAQVRTTALGQSLSRSLAGGATAAVRGIARLGAALGPLVGVAGLAGVAFAVRATVRSFADFEREMVKINTLVGVAGDQVRQWGERLKTLAVQVGVGPTELARALFVVTSAGIRTAEALKIVESAAKASAVGLGDTTTIARAVTAAMQAFGKQGLTAAEATDVLVATVREGNLEAGSLAGSLGRVLSIAAEAGATFADVGAFIATFTRVGVSAEEAVTSLRSVLNTFLKPADQARDALARLGLSADAVRQEIREKGLARALVTLADRLGGNVDALTEVIPNVRALAGFLSVARSQAEQFIAINDGIKNALGITDEAFETTTKTAAFQFAQLGAQFELLRIKVGESVLPIVNRFLPMLAQAFIRFLGVFLQLSVDFVVAMADLGRTIREFLTEQVRGIEKLVRLGSLLRTLPGPVGGFGKAMAGILPQVRKLATGVEGVGFTLDPELVDAARRTAAALRGFVAPVLQVQDALRGGTQGAGELRAAVEGLAGLQLRGAPLAEAVLPADIADRARRAAAELDALLEKFQADTGRDLGQRMTELGVDAGVNLMFGLLRGVKDAGDLVKQTLLSLVQAFVGFAFRKALGIFSPSQLTAGFGRQTVEGFVLGMEQSAARLAEASARVARIPAAAFGATAGVSPGLTNVNVSLRNLPRAVTPREQALSGAWQELFSETFRELESGGFRLRTG